MKFIEHIEKLQHFINVVKLLIRSKVGIKTTTAGDILYQHVRSILESTNTIDLEIRNQESAAETNKSSISRLIKILKLLQLISPILNKKTTLRWFFV